MPIFICDWHKFIGLLGILCYEIKKRCEQQGGIFNLTDADGERAKTVWPVLFRVLPLPFSVTDSQS